jgi:hypothetical protein
MEGREIDRMRLSIHGMNRPIRVAVLLIAAATAVAQRRSPLGVRPEESCTEADKAAANARTFTDAESAYRAVGKGACVERGLSALHAARASATALVVAGKKLEATDLGAARDKYVEALRLDPRSASAALALAALGEPRPDPFIEARALADLGLNDAAMKSLSAALKTADRKVPPEIEHVVMTGGGLPLWPRFVRWLARGGFTPEQFAAMLAAVLLAAWACWRRWAQPPRVEIADFNDDNLATGDPKLGKSLTALFREELSRKTQGNRLQTFSIASGPATPISIPADVSSKIPASASWITIIPSLIAWIHPARVISVTGVIHPRGLDGAGITLMMASGGRPPASSTLWQRHFDPTLKHQDAVSSYAGLAEPAAIWLLFHLGEEANA